MAALDAHLAAARPQALGALTRYFRDLDRAEEAFQDACVRALRTWPEKGLPRDPVAWLIFVGRNAGLDERRRTERWQALPPELDSLGSPGRGSAGTIARPNQPFHPRHAVAGDAETERVEAMEQHPYRDDVLRLLFICCHPALSLSHQIALALRVVAGLSVAEIARAFLIAPRAMEQRITRAKRRIAEADVPFATPSQAERTARLGAVSTMLYLLFNEGYSASGSGAPSRQGTVSDNPSREYPNPEPQHHDPHIRETLCREAIRLARLLVTLFPREPEIMGLLALCLLQHARQPARLDAKGEIILLEDQDRSLWHAGMIAEGLVMIEKALRRGRPGPLQIQAAIAAVHAQATDGETDWHEIERLYAALELLSPSPVVTLNRAVAVSKARGETEALRMIEPLAGALAGYFHFHGVRGALLAALGRVPDARNALTRALALARTHAEAEHIRHRLAELGEASSTVEESS